MNVHTEVVELVRSITPLATRRSDVRRMLMSCFAFLAAFVHGHAVNQVEVWAHRVVFERCFGMGVGAEVAVAEVRI